MSAPKLSEQIADSLVTGFIVSGIVLMAVMALGSIVAWCKL